MALNILYENDTVAVLDKPAGIDVEKLGEEIASYSPVFRALGQERRFGIVHRLDKDTSGILVVAKTAEAFR
ncbi:MAG: RNA pseudouridine synthase, partial [Candidatus Wildermuthbacteria bacterium]|nr:RNA pseudouridine synthase [Candidatus Wildermuthbacteria bacterium]